LEHDVSVWTEKVGENLYGFHRCEFMNPSDHELEKDSLFVRNYHSEFDWRLKKLLEIIKSN